VLSGLYQLVGFLDGSHGDAIGLGTLVIATVLAFVAGYAAIAFLLRFLVTHTTFVFIAYRVVLGTAVLVLFYAGVIS
jgi:undecaprenyl-diphosphatase